tara:strand:+ start:4648 stop:5466 length:819 start_codon:yes stop_codon:yes gene_type:complete
MNKFSVVMPLYFNENPMFFKEAVESLLNQTLIPDELIIVVDGPVGEKLQTELDIFSDNKKIKIIWLEENHGIGFARKKGIEKASHNILAVMDSDDISIKKRFELQLPFIVKENFEVVGGLIEEFDKEIGDTGLIRKLPILCKDIYKYGKWRMPVNNVTLMFTKDVYDKAGGYPELRSGEDWHLVAKWLANGAKFYNLNSVIVNVRGGPEMIKRRKTFNFQYHQLKVFPFMYKLKYIGIFHLFMNIFIRLILMVMPTLVTKYLYKFFLRSNKR